MKFAIEGIQQIKTQADDLSYNSDSIALQIEEANFLLKDY